MTSKIFYIKLGIVKLEKTAMDKKIIIEEALRLLGAYLDPTFNNEIGCIGSESLDDGIIVRFCTYNNHSHSAVITSITVSQEVLKK